MIQLKVYDNPAKVNQYWIDLYDTEPIKLTLSIEDITNADATSTYSKTFKVPGTRKNAEFFKNAFAIDGVLYDVTIKKPAEILVDGAEFRQGHIRLQKIFINTDLDRHDYELLFLGETRDLSSIIGDRALCELNMPDLVGNCANVPGQANGALTAANVQTSWLAFPQSPSLTAGLSNGNVLYPLIDHGNTYNEAGQVLQTEVRVGAVAGGSPFNTAAHPLALEQMKPMIRAKRIWDQIFEDAGYTYQSDFLDSELFHQIYISAFGNEAVPKWLANGPSSVNTLYAENLSQQNNFGLLLVNQNVLDPGNNYSTVSGHSQYLVRSSGNHTVRMSAYYIGYNENSNFIPIANLGRVRIMRNGSQIATSPLVNNGTVTVTLTYSFLQGDVITMDLDTQSGTQPDQGNVSNARFEVTAAPGAMSPSLLLDCNYKQIDFIKDILTSFRLVLAPDAYKPNNFIVEPWQTYIGSGELHDWSHKLVENKDVVAQPTFFTQSNIINFHFQRGGDWINTYHQAAYIPNEYGYLEFNSNNELLKGTREIKLTGIAPTELTQVEGTPQLEVFIVPQLHVHESTDGGTKHLPIKPKTRMLFYNGKQTINRQNDKWYLLGASNNPQAVWPLVSPYQDWPIQADSLTLNWANDVQYWGTVAGYNTRGVTLYDNYWSRYIESLYNKYARRVTAYFVLNNVDLNFFSFDDTIFVNGTYYTPEKIIDLQVGDYTEVQVQLLTANDFRPTFIQDQLLTGVTIEGFNVTCGEGLGYIEVETNGTPAFTWALTGGMNGTALVGAPAGNAPYNFTITNVPPGTYSITLTDSLGRDWVENVTVPLSSAVPVTATWVVTPASDCFTCDGAITVTPAGGIAPYEVNWISGPLDTPTRTNLCAPQTYSFVVGDALGCLSPIYNVELTCDTGFVYIARKHDAECTQLGLVDFIVESPTAINFGDVFSIGELDGCYSIIAETQQSPQYQVANFFIDCEACQGIPTNNNWDATECTTAQPIVIDFGIITPTPGEVYEVNGLDGCFEVTGTTEAAPLYTVLTGPYADCTECAGEPTQECLEYTVSNYSGSELLYFEYVDCFGLPTQSTVNQDSDVVICSIGAPFRIGGSNSYLISPTGISCE